MHSIFEEVILGLDKELHKLTMHPIYTEDLGDKIRILGKADMLGSLKVIPHTNPRDPKVKVRLEAPTVYIDRTYLWKDGVYVNFEEETFEIFPANGLEAVANFLTCSLYGRIMAPGRRLDSKVFWNRCTAAAKQGAKRSQGRRFEG